MIDICTVSDEVFVWMAVQESSEQWIQSYKEKEAYEHGHGSLKKGGSRVRTYDNIAAQNGLTETVIVRRDGPFAKQWCEMVREASYDIPSLLSSTSGFKDVDLSICTSRKNDKKSSNASTLILVLPGESNNSK